VVGLGYGDEGKGSLVDWLARRLGGALVARYNGGPQAAHHVVTPEGIGHCFAQFGSATLAGANETYLSRQMFVDPLALIREAEVLAGKGVTAPLQRLILDPQAPLITPWHAVLNRLREARRGSARHGSCGMGVGEAYADARRPDSTRIQALDLADRRHLLRLLGRLQEEKWEQARALHGDQGPPSRPLGGLSAEDLADRYHRFIVHSGVRIDGPHCLQDHLAAGGRLIFEGAQGVLLDETHGFWPHVTPSRTTSANAEALWSELGQGGALIRLGVLRAYATRHGPGPFVTEDPALAAALPERHNADGPWQGPMRLGWFDLPASRYALAVNGGVELLAVSNLDRLAGRPEVRLCHRYLGPAGEALEDIPAAPRHAPADQRTRHLLACRADYETHPAWSETSFPSPSPAAEAFLERIAAGLGMPVSLRSWGPTAHHKHLP
jgi:adenylosuccinate synthase